MLLKSLQIMAVGLSLAACAPPPPEPIVPDAVYNKYGNAVAECRPSGQNINSTYVATLPTCEEFCRRTGRDTANVTHANVPQYRCRRPDDNGGNDRPNNPNTPNNPNSPTRG